MKLFLTIKRHIPFISALIIFWLTISILIVLSIRENDGHFVYPLDDPYIHMAMAKNFSKYGLWSVDRYHNFTSSSSSPLWTLLISLTYLIFGVNEITPLILNIIFASLCLLISYIILRKYILSNITIFIILFVIIFLTPLSSLTLCGLEHTLHSLLVILFLYFSSNILSVDSIHKKFEKEKIFLFIIGIFSTVTRYESLFMIFAVCFIFLLKRDFLFSFLLVIISASPFLLYGIISKVNGWAFLPNTILRKGKFPDLSSIKGIMNFLGMEAFKEIMKNPHILTLILSILIILTIKYKKGESFWKMSNIMMFILMILYFLHMEFAKTGWFYRYEAYLIPISIISLSIGISYKISEGFKLNFNKKNFLQDIPYIMLLLLIFFPLGRRGLSALCETIQATKNIYEQQYQMGLFLKEYYNSENVALNDIGATNFISDIKCIDIYGLANFEIYKLFKEKKFDVINLQRIVKEKDVKIAILYESWFKLPKIWKKVGEWRIFNNVVCGDDKVSFFAVDTSEFDKLKRNLKEFSSRLPLGVVQKGEYLK